MPTQQLHRLLLAVMLLAMFVPAAPRTRAAETISPCKYPSPTSWGAAFTVTYNDSVTWTTTEGYSTFTHTASAELTFDIAGLSEVIDPRFQSPSAPLSGPFTLRETYSVQETVAVPGQPVQTLPPVVEELNVEGETSAGTSIQIFETNQGTCKGRLFATIELIVPDVLWNTLTIDVTAEPAADTGFQGRTEAIEFSWGRFDWGNPEHTALLGQGQVEGFVPPRIAEYYDQYTPDWPVNGRVDVGFAAEAGQIPTPPPPTPDPRNELAIESVTLEHGDYPSGDWMPVPASGTFDGNIVRVTVAIRNPGDQPVEALLDVAEAVSNTDITTCPTVISIPPTGDGAPREVQCTWDTSDFAWSRDAMPEPLGERVIRVALTPVGGELVSQDTPIQVRPRPLFVIPTVNATEAAYETFRNVVQDVWRSDWVILPVPGLLTGGDSGREPSLPVEENAERLHAYIEQQRAALDAWRIDLLGHGLGGLTARFYIWDHMGNLGDGTPVVRNLLMAGTPNRGTPCANVYLAINAALDIPNEAAWLDHHPIVVYVYNLVLRTKPNTVRYVAMGSNAQENLDCVEDADQDGQPDPSSERSDGLVPISSALALGIREPLSKRSHHRLLEQLPVVDRVIYYTGTPVAAASTNELDSFATQATAETTGEGGVAPIAAVFSADVPAGATVERPLDVPAATQLGVSLQGVDGLTASLISPSGQVAVSGTYSGTTTALLRADQPEAGRWTMRLTNDGTEARQVLGAMQLLGTSFIATAHATPPDADGTRLLTAALSDAGDPVTGATVTARIGATGSRVTLADDGQSGDGAADDGVYAAQINADNLNFLVVEVRSSAGDRLVPVVAGPAELAVTPPTVDAGGPYSVAEGARVELNATGESVLSYAWDLDGDGSFESDDQEVTFSAAGLDGPVSRLVRVRATDPATGLSATSAALVEVANVAPTATFVAPSEATVGQPFEINLTGASDPGDDPLQFAFDCGQGFGSPGNDSSATCTPAAAGTLTVRAQVADDDGDETIYTATVTVADAPGGAEPVPVNDLLSMDGMQTAYNAADTRAPAGVYTIRATFTNRGAQAIDGLFFTVTRLTGGNQLLNADGAPGGAGATLTVPAATPGETFRLHAGDSVTVVFEIGLQERKAFDFLVDAYGTLVGSGLAGAAGGDLLAGYHFPVSAESLQASGDHQLYLPLVLR